MKINNNVSSPNFGALKIIHPNAISGMTKDECENLYKAGEELKDTEVFNLVICKGGIPLVTDGNRFYRTPISVDKPDGNIFKFTAHPQYGGSRINSYSYPLATADMAAEAYEKMSKCVSELDKSIELTKILDKSAQFQKTQSFKRQASERQLQHLKQDLYKKYGTDR